MTRVRFLNDLYHHLYGLTQEQAEQHLTYYAEMLADRMEEGMSEEEAVAGMEDVETIARRIMEEEGLPYTPPEQRPVVPPSYPDVTKMGGNGGGGGGGGFTRAYKSPQKSNWQPYAKVALWVVAIIVVVGVVGGFIENFFGWGGRNSVMTDTPTEHPPVAVVDTATAEYSESWEYTNMPYEMGYSYTEGDCYFGIDDVNGINIEWAAGTVFIQTYGGDGVVVKEYSEYELNDRTRMSWWLENDLLTITYRDGTGLGNVKGAKWLSVLVPEGQFGEISINTTSAEVSAVGLELDTLRVNTVSGDISCMECYMQTSEFTSISGDILLTHLYADRAAVSTGSGYVSGEMQCADISANTVSGDATLTLYDRTEKVDLNTGSGDIWASIEDPSIRSISAASISGDISLSIPWDMGYTLDYTTVSGDVDFPTYDGSWPPSKNGQYIHEGGECKIDVSTTSGNLSIY